MCFGRDRRAGTCNFINSSDRNGNTTKTAYLTTEQPADTRSLYINTCARAGIMSYKRFILL